MNTGEILIAYGLRIKPYNLDIQAWSTYNTRFKLVSPGFDFRTLKPDELSAVKELQEWWGTRGGAPGAKGDIIRRDSMGTVINEDGPLKSRKFSHIGGMQINGYYDIVCEVLPCLAGELTMEVVKTYPGYPHTVYVTDYTQNLSLHIYSWSPNCDWKGPFGKYTLQISCWDGTSDQASNCKVGGFYIFKNVRAKLSRPSTIHVLMVEADQT